MIGAEFADRTGPMAGLRVLGPFDDMTCDVCGAPHAVCTDKRPPEPAPVDVEALVADRAAQQVRRPPGRPPTDPAKRAAYDAQVAAATAAGGETIDAAGMPAVDAAPAAAPAAPPIPAGDPGEVRDVHVTPEGLLDPADDPNRPNPATTVLVTERAQVFDTGAWMTLPGRDTVALTRDVQQVWWPMGCRAPSYKMVAKRGKVLPHPRPVI